MRTLSLVIFLSAISMVASAEELTKEELLKLHEAGFRSSILITKIQSSEIAFEVDTDTMLELLGAREITRQHVELISRARIDIEAMRLMVLRAARAMDVLGNREARIWVHDGPDWTARSDVEAFWCSRHRRWTGIGPHSFPQ